MKSKTAKRIVTLVLCFAMLLTVVPAAFATTANWQETNVVFSGTGFGTNGYYNVISKKDYTLIPGAAVESEMVLNNAAGNRRQVLHIIEVDPSNPDVSIVPGYYGIDKDLSDVNNQVAAKLTDMTAYYEDVLGYNIVGGMNTSLAYDNNAPIDVLVYNGVNLSQGAHKAQTFLAVIKDPATEEISCKLYNYADGIPENCLHAVSCNFGFIVNEGELVVKTEERTSAAAARSMIGIKEDGTLVLVMNDGRGANNSIGFNNYELGESMLALGCKWAVNCDGGGSSTFVSKRVGEDVNTMRSSPCDYAERPTINGVFVVSNVAPTGVLGNVEIEADYDYFAPGSTFAFGASAIDTHGYAMDMPEGITWQLSDGSFGTVNDGTFVSNGTKGEVTVEILYEGEKVGEKAITVADPTNFSLSATNVTLPYSTAEKVRTITLPIVAKVGENDVYFDPSTVSATLQNAASGVLEGYNFTAASDETVTGAKITVTYIPTNISLTYNVTYGKGSEILWDFEDGDISEWVGTDEAEEWLKENGVTATGNGEWETRFKTLFAGGQISWSTKTTTFLSSRENGGKVKNGNYSLGINFDMRNTEFNSWVYVLVWNIQGNTVLRDTANGKNATTLGMWLYLPEGFYTAKNNGAVAWQLTAYTNRAHTSGTQLNLQYNGKNINALNETMVPENRWIYVTANLTGYSYLSLVDPLNDKYRSPSFIRGYIKPSEAQVLTYYMDDITLDYSSAVDDRNPPVISDATYCTADTNIALDGQTITTNKISFNANVADYAASNAEGLDYNTAAIYIDGVAQSGVKASGSAISIDDVTVANGEHKITFEIADKLGNYTTLTKQFSVNAANALSMVTLSGHNDLGNTPQAGSVYYADIKAQEIEKIDSVTATLYLQTANKWELDHMTVAEGFEAAYSVSEAEPNRVTVTVTKTDETNFTGEQTLVSVPVRLWTFDEDTWVGGDSSLPPAKMTAAQRFATSYGEPVLRIEVTAEKGAIEYSDGETGTFFGSFDVATAVNGNKTTAWHTHTVTALADKAATCTENGYTDRTYCEVCGSVVDWGATLPATGHTYKVTGDKIACVDCGRERTDTGLFEIDGELYYLISGTLVTGWQSPDGGDNYFFHTKNYAALKGEQIVYGTEYTFDENGVLIKGSWAEHDGRYVYHWAGRRINHRFYEIDGKTYYFDIGGYMLTGFQRFALATGDEVKSYLFDENGVYLSENGVHRVFDDIYYVENGHPVAKGLFKDGDDYYYINSTCKAVKDRDYYVYNSNGLMESATYSFDAEGKMIINTAKDGFVEENGHTYYYENGVKTYAGLIFIDGCYYYVNSACEMATGKRYIYKTNDLLPNSTYDFGTDGKMIFSASKNGFVEEGGHTYYYVNGVKTYAGLILIDGDYYYVNSAGEMATGRKYTYKSNGLLPEGAYDFGTDGKMVFSASKNGFIEENGHTYYYVNGVKTYAGLILIDGDYYYVNSAGEMATGRKYTYKSNGLLPEGAYEFGADGKMIIPEVKNGFVEENGHTYYYVDGVKTYAGLIIINGDYYYVNSACEMTTGTRYLYKTNDLLPNATYTFGTDGKMVIPEVKNGFVEENGHTYYYENGVKTYAGLIIIDGDYYYVNSGCEMTTGTRYLYKTNDLLPNATYTFGADGKMVR